MADKDIFLSGELDAVLQAVRQCVIHNPITVEELIDIIELSGRLSSYGIKAGLVLLAQDRSLGPS